MPLANLFKDAGVDMFEEQVQMIMSPDEYRIMDHLVSAVDFNVSAHIQMQKENQAVKKKRLDKHIRKDICR